MTLPQILRARAEATRSGGSAPGTSVIFVSSNTLTVVTPANPAGVADVTVTNVNGSSTLVAWPVPRFDMGWF